MIVLHKIAVISDTHGLLRPEILDILHGCEAILHGGDINKQKIIDELIQIAPLHVVRGNNDKDWAKDLPETLSFSLYGIRFFMVHNKKMIPKDITDTDIIIYGHSHKYEEKYKGSRLWLNPGSCGPRRFTQPVTMAVLEIAESQELSAGAAPFRVEKIDLTQRASVAGTAGESESVQQNEKIPQNIKLIIQSVMKETDRGKPVREIAAKNGISEELAEQICRLYLTHPGVDADGIMGKMGL